MLKSEKVVEVLAVRVVLYCQDLNHCNLFIGEIGLKFRNILFQDMVFN